MMLIYLPGYLIHKNYHTNYSVCVCNRTEKVKKVNHKVENKTMETHTWYLKGPGRLSLDGSTLNCEIYVVTSCHSLTLLSPLPCGLHLHLTLLFLATQISLTRAICFSGLSHWGLAEARRRYMEKYLPIFQLLLEICK